MCAVLSTDHGLPKSSRGRGYSSFAITQDLAASDAQMYGAPGPSPGQASPGKGGQVRVHPVAKVTAHFAISQDRRVMPTLQTSASIASICIHTFNASMRQ